ncbi:GGDEF domain-containing protein [uncultured Roseovarius sp.]|uniref:GGDEF domain-containing protein n=1 Tax=uncultured Roseovarius sp. TaxID=293344 RepID=UPI0026061E7B|nr:GGDEF domain-containing protein [uncultured Roseovarius sp.]
MAGNYVLQYLMLPADVFERVLFSSEIITVMLAAPLSYYIGTKLLDVNDLTVQLEHAVNHDNLTGTCTRLSFYHRLAQMEDVQLVTIVTDIDHFKQVNDKYGHQAGDSVLKQFANTLLRNCREEDVVARFGGEEFIVLLQDVSLEDGVLAAQRLCDRVREKKFMANGQRLHITASFGVAEVETVSEVDDAIHKADLAAFRAKRNGRDKVYSYDPELDSDAPHSQAAE